METTDGFDVEISRVLEATYQAALMIGSKKYSPAEIKLLILAADLEALAKTFLLVDDREEVTMDLKQVALGILGTVDWVRDGLE